MKQNIILKSVEKITFKIKKIIVVAVISLFFSFAAYMGILTVIRGSKTLDKLDHIQGEITSVRFIKHKYQRKFKTVFKDVLVLSIEGTVDEFGFTEDSDAYKKLIDFRVSGKPAEIYYDRNGKQIEQGVTLHTFDFKIGNYQVVDIADIKRSERMGSILFFSAALVLLIIAVIVIRKKEQPKFRKTFPLDED